MGVPPWVPQGEKKMQSLTKGGWGVPPDPTQVKSPSDEEATETDGGRTARVVESRRRKGARCRTLRRCQATIGGTRSSRWRPANSKIRDERVDDVSEPKASSRQVAGLRTWYVRGGRSSPAAADEPCPVMGGGEELTAAARKEPTPLSVV